MRISAKTRYGLAAVISMAESADPSECTTVIRLAQRLDISKIYLEQVFSLLRRGGIVHSIQGAQGGYLLSRAAEEISLYEVLKALELSLFEKTADTVSESDAAIEEVLQKDVFGVMEQGLKDSLAGITLQSLATKAARLREGEGYMYYL